MATDRRQAIRNIIIFAILVNGLAWLGPVLGGDPTTPGLGFLVWAVAPLLSALMIKFLLSGILWPTPSWQDSLARDLSPWYRARSGWAPLAWKGYG